MKNLSKVLLALSVASVSAGVLASENESITVHINGAVTQPTCAFTSPDQSVNLQAVKASELEKLNIGQASETNSKDFQLQLNCVSKAEAEHISITLAAETEGDNNIIKNTASENGVGLELFDEQNQLLALNRELPQSSYLDRLNQGSDNLNFRVKYARLADNVSGGEVAGDAVFTVNYK
ncbi:fimbrial protein [Franconibacter helveticus]|uniref:fimbrial protein n=1 Tax=Franconibacter helveticus TaxID=357240 RepID=UPI000DA147B3|nr:fimbrial protein [Franconibacter helveticus]